ncbi:MAG: Prolipoprotein diacylglyceryl transferase [Pelotomaculum sp. PtaU1.Bin035]|nr:MAG: Prolipoprotein diacylglyceryl transferase [Pelotomaculum sp. PtaU1.Bin035]
MISPVAFQIGPLSIYWYGIIMTAAFILGTVLAYRHATMDDIDPEHVLNLLVLVIPAAIIGARLYYVFFNWEDYSSTPMEILAIRHGGLAIHGGLLGGFLAGFIYVRKNRLNFWRMGDIFAPSIILGQAIGRWGNFFNQEAFGGPVSSEFISRFPGFIQKQMFIGGQYHHPTFLYESLWNLLVFTFLMVYHKRVKFHGQVLLYYLALYSTGRFFIEGLRTDSLMLGPVRVAQFVSLAIIATVAILLLNRKRKQIKHKVRLDAHTNVTELNKIKAGD